MSLGHDSHASLLSGFPLTKGWYLILGMKAMKLSTVCCEMVPSLNFSGTHCHSMRMRGMLNSCQNLLPAIKVGIS